MFNQYNSEKDNLFSKIYNLPIKNVLKMYIFEINIFFKQLKKNKKKMRKFFKKLCHEFESLRIKIKH